MKFKKIFSAFLSSAAALSLAVMSVSAQTESIDMQDAGYGINGGRSFTADGITAYESTLGDLSEKYDTIDFTISADDLGGRTDLTFQVYVSADNWAIWANGNETPAIEAAGTDYTFSLNVDDIAELYGSDKVICDMGFQIMSSTPGAVNVTYSYDFSTGGNSAPAEADNSEAPAADSVQSTSPQTGNAPVSVLAVTAVLSAAAAMLSRKKK